MVVKKLLAKNDEADPQFVLPLTFFSLVMGCIFTGMGIVLASQDGNKIALAVISGVALLSWASLALLIHKYRHISM